MDISLTVDVQGTKVEGRVLATTRLYEFRPLRGGGNSTTSQCSGALVSSGIWMFKNANPCARGEGWLI